MAKRLIYILLALTMLGTIAYFYINNILLPVKVKKMIIQNAPDQIHRNVDIGNIRFSPFKGLVFQDIKIYEKGSSTETFLTASSAHFKVFLIPLLKDKKIIIPSLNIEQANISLTRDTINQWNFSDMLERESSPEKGNYNVLLKKLVINDGTLNLLDTTGETPFEEQISNITTQANILLNKSINFLLSAQIKKYRTELNLEGNYNFPDKKLISKVQASNLYLKNYLFLINNDISKAIKESILSDAKLNVEYVNDALGVTGNFKIDNILIHMDDNIINARTAQAQNIEVTWKDQTLHAKGQLNMTASDIFLSPNKHMKGSVTAKLDSLIAHKDSLQFSGNLDVTDAALTVNESQQLTTNLTAKIITFKRENGTTELQGDYMLENARFNDGKNLDMKATVTATNTLLTKKSENLQLHGQYDLTNTDFSFGDNKHFKGSITTSNTNLDVEDGRINFSGQLNVDKTDIALGEQKTLTGVISSNSMQIIYQHPELSFNSDNITIKNAVLHIAENQMFRGNPEISVTLNLNPDKTPEPSYSGKILMKNAELTGLPRIGTISNIQGSLSFNSHSISSEKLTLTALEEKLIFKGNLENFQSPDIDASLTSENVQLENLKKYLKDFIPNDFDSIDVSGPASITVRYQGALQDPSKANIVVKSELKNNRFFMENLKGPVENISGDLRYENETLIWKNLKGSYLAKTYNLDGHFKNLTKPLIETNVSSDNLSLFIQLNLLNNAFQFHQLKGTYLNHRFDLKGDIHTFNAGSPDFDFRGTANIDLRNLKLLSPALAEKVENHKLDGVIAVDGLFKGKLQDWRDWQLTFEAQANEITLDKITFYDLTMRYGQRDRAVSQFAINSGLYNGTMLLSGTADLTKETIPIQGLLRADKVDLSLIRREFDIKNKKFSGKLKTETKFQTTAADFLNLKGQGSLDIGEGYLWQLIPQLEDVNFTDLKSTFTLQDRKVVLNKALLLSQTLVLDTAGWIGFDQGLDSRLNINVLPRPIEVPNVKAGGMTFDPTSLARQIVSIECKGTLKNPGCTKNVSPTRVLKETGDILKEGGKIFGSILDDLL